MNENINKNHFLSDENCGEGYHRNSPTEYEVKINGAMLKKLSNADGSKWHHEFEIFYRESSS